MKLFNKLTSHSRVRRHALPGDAGPRARPVRAPARRPVNALLAISCCLLAFAGLAGCSAPARKAPPPISSGSEGIEELNLLSMPMALNLDANPGADGVAVKVFANMVSNAKTVEIAEGRIEILLYDGVINAETKDIPPALHVWTFTAKALKPFAFKKSIGTGYDLVLAWGQDQPLKNRVTIIARHISDRGRTVFSGPVTVTVTSF